MVFSADSGDTQLRRMSWLVVTEQDVYTVVPTALAGPVELFVAQGRSLEAPLGVALVQVPPQTHDGACCKDVLLGHQPCGIEAAFGPQAH